MSRRADVKITYLRNRTAELIREVSEVGHVVTITQNGEARAVLMAVDTYDRWRAADE
jgi:prevent-host-death family protein